MRTIYKYTLHSWPQTFSMHEGWRLVHVGFQHDRVTVWAMIDTDAPVVKETFQVFGTGSTDKKNFRVVKFNFDSVLMHAHGVGFDTMTIQCESCGSFYRCKGRRGLWSVDGKLVDSDVNYILIALREVTG